MMDGYGLVGMIVGGMMVMAALVIPDIVQAFTEKRKHKKDHEKSKKEKKRDKLKDDMRDVMNQFHTFVDDLDRYSKIMKDLGDNKKTDNESRADTDVDDLGKYSQIMKDISDDKKADDESHVDTESSGNYYNIPVTCEYIAKMVGLNPKSPMVEELLGLLDIDIDGVTADNVKNLYGTISGYYKCAAFIFRKYILMYQKVPTKVREQFRRIYVHIDNAGCFGPSDKALFLAIYKIIEPTTEEIVDEVIALEWGKGAERRNRLTEAGYNYEIIQRHVNRKVKDMYGVDAYED